MKRPACQKQQGFTLIEVLIATLIVAVFLVPAIQALSSVAHVGGAMQLHAERESVLQDRFNEILALPFRTLAQAAGSSSALSSYSDPTTASPRKLVYISHFDGDSTGNSPVFFDVASVDPELLWIHIAYADTNDGLSTLVRH